MGSCDPQGSSNLGDELKPKHDKLPTKIKNEASDNEDEKIQGTVLPKTEEGINRTVEESVSPRSGDHEAESNGSVSCFVDGYGDNSSMKEEPDEALGDEFDAFISDMQSRPSLTSKPPPSSGLLSDSSGLISSKSCSNLYTGLGSTAEITVDRVPVVWLKGPEEVDRLITLSLRNAADGSLFDALKVPPHASEYLIKQHFKKLSLLIHPDKCKHPRANDAFQVLTKAFEEVMKPEYRQQYSDVIEDAKAAIINERKKENKKRSQQKKPPLPSYSDEELKVLVLQRCEAMVKERKERADYAARTRKANEDLEKQTEVRAKEEEFRRNLEKQKWDSDRDNRVDSWRSFKCSTPMMRMPCKVEHREVRCNADADVQAKRRRQMGEDYKQSWR